MAKTAADFAAAIKEKNAKQLGMLRTSKVLESPSKSSQNSSQQSGEFQRTNCHQLIKKA